MIPIRGVGLVHHGYGLGGSHVSLLRTDSASTGTRMALGWRDKSSLQKSKNCTAQSQRPERGFVKLGQGFRMLGRSSANPDMFQEID